MKKTFRLAAVLVTLAALVMASCQNAAGGSGGGGGGGVTPTPTPTPPQAEYVKGPAIKLVGSYEIEKFASIVLGPDGNGVLNFGAPSASTRAILLNDYPFEWGIADAKLEKLANKSGSSVSEEDVAVPYLKLTFEEGANVTVTGTITYTKKDSAGTDVEDGTLDLEDGFALNIDYTDASNNRLSFGDYDMAGTDPVFNDALILSGILGKIEIDGVEFDVDDGSGGALMANPPKAAELAGTWTATSESEIVAVVSTTNDEFDGAETVADKFKLIPTITEDEGAGATAIYMVTGVRVTNGGSTADVDIIIYDYDNIDKNFKENKGDPTDPTTKNKGGLNYFVITKPEDASDPSSVVPAVEVQVSDMKKLAETDEDSDPNRGFATGVIADCKLTVSGSDVVLTKVIDPDTSATDVTTVLTLKPNVPFASASPVLGDYAKKGSGKDVSATIMYQKGVVTE